ncbi:PREDICTED: neuroparsin-A-like [Nicrophorus vespilloides]|uniref:Neuroparsin-A-like n=1 Tax=Nicrophorus vespilloides TaxID=110193 RepID=A0ABM1NBM6_NICVS|nr:PREDICTED: neuroparsin-A-like [Nicrophorus vespilloides]XP_017784226.1 PREDICTED: neuroparsin-A-like [Nicrophorus vespilloides]XP_017784227.1 PREDICTED: neuroparsin-A-like [Nicrophorus vespilloides]XP_017784228.1 PREDICTED: neuroparsin-A-like [Nicrophorus vespilloides]
MQTISIISLLFAVTLSFVITNMAEARAPWICQPCDMFEECNKEPESYCMWGETRNSCNRRVCAKGPGERCGGLRDIFGRCGTGMWCQKEDESNTYTCHGCYDNSLECHQSTRY